MRRQTTVQHQPMPELSFLKRRDDRTWTRLPLALELLLVVLFNGAITLFLFAIGVGDSLAVTAITSQCIGLSIYGMMALASVKLGAPVTRHLPAMTAAIIVGAVIGVTLAALLTPLVTDTPPFRARVNVVQALVIGLMFGTIATLGFLLRSRLADTHDALQQTRLQQLIAERERVQMELRMLRAQVEPHFLFNTLANVDSLLESDPERGRYMLRRLTDYLRSSLTHSRREHATLELELDVVRAYLDIMALRMGSRLKWVIDAEPSLAAVPMAPMLLQPLVENAIRHGLEPAVSGGTITIRAARDGAHLCVSVCDDGVGLTLANGAPGTGLDNVRGRLTALYGHAARLIVEDAPGGGVCATIYVPLPDEAPR
jgi:sensor histidine kinase YesM